MAVQRREGKSITGTGEEYLSTERERERENVDAIEKVRNRWVESASR